MPIAVAVVGGKKSGKTTTIEILTRKLAEKGYRIAAVKHISEPDFTIDSEGKDTWRYAQSGAKLIVGISLEEIATIEKTECNKTSLEEILQRCKDSDIVFLEGFKKIVAKNKDVYKILVAKSAEELEEGLKSFEPILAFTGPYKPKSSKYEILYVDVQRNPEVLAELVIKAIMRKTAT